MRIVSGTFHAERQRESQETRGWRYFATGPAMLSVFQAWRFKHELIDLSDFVTGIALDINGGELMY